VLGVVAWQISTPGRSATAAAACMAGFVYRPLARGVQTRPVTDCRFGVARSRAPIPSESLELVGGGPTSGAHLGKERRPVLGVVAWQISTPDRSATAAAAWIAGFVRRRLPRGMQTQPAADYGLMVARVSRNGRPANRQDEHCFARSANDGEVAAEESEAGECRQSSVEVISGSHLGADDSSGFKNGTAPDVLRHSDRRQAAMKHDRRGVREDFYRAPGE
jgi:hypothetical protein